MQGKKILVTGLTGQVGKPVAKILARQNEIWGLARFSDPSKKLELEQAGIRCVAADLVRGDFSAVPTDFDYVLNFAVYRGEAGSFDEDITANAEAAGLLMAHCRKARAFLHCSTTGVYNPQGQKRLKETDDLGDHHKVMLKTYSITKIATEAVVRTMARHLGLPAIIGRLNVPYGDNGGWPLAHLTMMKHGMAIPVHPNKPGLYTMIHEEDIARTIPALLGAATVPARIVNWGHQDTVSVEEWCAYLGELTGLVPKFNYTDQTIESAAADVSQLIALAGPMQVGWKEGLRRMVRTHHPDWLVTA
ncbi:MAG: NAD(P)-dependent oxidoreductase [Proteobacteria bacterium]|nr:NAD(P)-dependent oxidoreductase [Pseudomonadota bacterium]HQR04469.1 NAD(P)-dependent oxidoreductase [Rhodocyclaceae bacterium]